eukprot:CAMPEP_0179068244 /NCGR_PEP_ID=MMETSP0796-20121207/29904_1 /TAXON_ID=73915 /ORGANISM="Pyrodinium bahamense, Strain pbaha01" /LENGTH=278 /DNA_ID=CAMNT_0020765297 /DNA_START=125 /DNA_END=961 /DNA_ORIENTATION=-
MAAEAPAAAWDKLREEFEVQKLVWQSLGMVRGKTWVEGRLNGVQPMVEHVLAQGSAEAVERVLAGEDPEGDLFSHAMREALTNAARQQRAAEARRQLAERLHLSSIPASLPREDADKKEVEALVVACHIEDTRLERIIRKALLLPVPVELGAPVTGAKNLSGMGIAVTDPKVSASLGGAVTVAKMSTSSGLPAKASHSTSSGAPARYTSLLLHPEPFTKTRRSLGTAVTGRPEAQRSSGVGAEAARAGSTPSARGGQNGTLIRGNAAEGQCMGMVRQS